MAAGLPQGKNEINQRAGNLAWQTREVLRQWGEFKTYLDELPNGVGTTKAALELLGFDPADAQRLIDAAAAGDRLRRVATGQLAQSPADDLTFHMRRLTGPQ